MAKAKRSKGNARRKKSEYIPEEPPAAQVVHQFYVPMPGDEFGDEPDPRMWESDWGKGVIEQIILGLRETALAKAKAANPPSEVPDLPSVMP